MALPRRDGGHASTEASAVQAADPCLDATALVDGAPAVLSSAAWHALLHGGRDAFSSVEEAEALAGAAPLAWDALLDALALVASACRRCAACADDLFGAGGAARQRRRGAARLGACGARPRSGRSSSATARRRPAAAATPRCGTRTTDARRCCGTSRATARRSAAAGRPRTAAPRRLSASADGRGTPAPVVARGGGPSAKFPTARPFSARGGRALSAVSTRGRFPARTLTLNSGAQAAAGGVRPRRGRGVGRGAAAARARARRRAAAPPRARGDLVRAPPAPAPRRGRRRRRRAAPAARGASRPGHGEAWDMAAHFYAECLPFLDDDGAARDDGGARARDDDALDEVAPAGVGGATARAGARALCGACADAHALRRRRGLETRAPWFALALRAGKRAALASPCLASGSRHARLEDLDAVAPPAGDAAVDFGGPKSGRLWAAFAGPASRAGGAAGLGEPASSTRSRARRGARPSRSRWTSRPSTSPGARAAGLFGAAARRGAARGQPARRCDRCGATLERGRGDAPRADAARFALVCDLFLRRLPAPRPPGRGGFWAGRPRAQLDLLRSLRRCAPRGRGRGGAAAVAAPRRRARAGRRLFLGLGDAAPRPPRDAAGYAASRRRANLPDYLAGRDGALLDDLPELRDLRDVVLVLKACTARRRAGRGRWRRRGARWSRGVAAATSARGASTGSRTSTRGSATPSARRSGAASSAATDLATAARRRRLTTTTAAARAPAGWRGALARVRAALAGYAAPRCPPSGGDPSHLAGELVATEDDVLHLPLRATSAPRRAEPRRGAAPRRRHRGGARRASRPRPRGSPPRATARAAAATSSGSSATSRRPTSACPWSSASSRTPSACGASATRGSGRRSTPCSSSAARGCPRTRPTTPSRSQRRTGGCCALRGLFNELVMSPGPTCTAVARLLDLALGLDAGRWAPRGVAELVLFATRVAARALSFLAALDPAPARGGGLGRRGRAGLAAAPGASRTRPTAATPSDQRGARGPPRRSPAPRPRSGAGSRASSPRATASASGGPARSTRTRSRRRGRRGLAAAAASSRSSARFLGAYDDRADRDDVADDGDPRPPRGGARARSASTTASSPGLAAPALRSSAGSAGLGAGGPAHGALEAVVDVVAAAARAAAPRRGARSASVGAALGAAGASSAPRRRRRLGAAAAARRRRRPRAAAALRRRRAAPLARAGPREAWVGGAPLLGDRAPLAGFALFLPRSFDAAAGFCAVVGFLDRGGARHWRECHAGRGGERGGAFVEVYEVAEHGRSWWRSLCYTSDAGRSLGAPRHSEDDFEDGGDCGCEAWPFARGHAGGRGAPAPSVDVSRRDGGGAATRQTHVPDRHLRGLLPDALLDAYAFWRNADDASLCGYCAAPPPSSSSLAAPARPRVVVTRRRVEPGAGGPDDAPPLPDGGAYGGLRSRGAPQTLLSVGATAPRRRGAPRGSTRPRTSSSGSRRPRAARSPSTPSSSRASASRSGARRSRRRRRPGGAAVLLDHGDARWAGNPGHVAFDVDAVGAALVPATPSAAVYLALCLFLADRLGGPAAADLPAVRGRRPAAARGRRHALGAVELRRRPARRRGRGARRPRSRRRGRLRPLPRRRRLALGPRRELPLAVAARRTDAWLDDDACETALDAALAAGGGGLGFRPAPSAPGGAVANLRAGRRGEPWEPLPAAGDAGAPLETPGRRSRGRGPAPRAGRRRALRAAGFAGGDGLRPSLGLAGGRAVAWLRAHAGFRGAGSARRGRSAGAAGDAARGGAVDTSPLGACYELLTAGLPFRVGDRDGGFGWGVALLHVLAASSRRARVSASRLGARGARGALPGPERRGAAARYAPPARPKASSTAARAARGRAARLAAAAGAASGAAAWRELVLEAAGLARRFGGGATSRWRGAYAYDAAALAAEAAMGLTLRGGQAAALAELAGRVERGELAAPDDHGQRQDDAAPAAAPGGGGGDDDDDDDLAVDDDALLHADGDELAEAAARPARRAAARRRRRRASRRASRSRRSGRRRGRRRRPAARRAPGAAHATLVSSAWYAAELRPALSARQRGPDPASARPAGARQPRLARATKPSGALGARRATSGAGAPADAQRSGSAGGGGARCAAAARRALRGQDRPSDASEFSHPDVLIGLTILAAADCRGALTLSKDSTYRDLAQAAFRLRRLGAGQTLALLVSPELAGCLAEARAAPRAAVAAALGDDAAWPALLRELLAWLAANGLRRGVNFFLLAEQSVANVARKASRRAGTGRRRRDVAARARARRPSGGRPPAGVAFDVENAVPAPRPCSERIAQLVEEHADLMTDAPDFGARRRSRRLRGAAAARQRGGAAAAFEGLQEQEAEEEAEEEQAQEREQERRVEAEAEAEPGAAAQPGRGRLRGGAPEPWPVAALRAPPGPGHVFYALADLRVAGDGAAAVAFQRAPRARTTTGRGGPAPGPRRARARAAAADVAGPSAAARARAGFTARQRRRSDAADAARARALGCANLRDGPAARRRRRPRRRATPGPRRSSPRSARGPGGVVALGLAEAEHARGLLHAARRRGARAPPFALRVVGRWDGTADGAAAAARGPAPGAGLLLDALAGRAAPDGERDATALACLQFFDVADDLSPARVAAAQRSSGRRPRARPLRPAAVPPAAARRALRRARLARRRRGPGAGRRRRRRGPAPRAARPCAPSSRRSSSTTRPASSSTARRPRRSGSASTPRARRPRRSCAAAQAALSALAAGPLAPAAARRRRRRGGRVARRGGAAADLARALDLNGDGWIAFDELAAALRAGAAAARQRPARRPTCPCRGSGPRPRRRRAASTATRSPRRWRSSTLAAARRGAAGAAGAPRRPPRAPAAPRRRRARRPTPRGAADSAAAAEPPPAASSPTTPGPQRAARGAAGARARLVVARHGEQEPVSVWRLDGARAEGRGALSVALGDFVAPGLASPRAAGAGAAPPAAGAGARDAAAGARSASSSATARRSGGAAALAPARRRALPPPARYTLVWHLPGGDRAVYGWAPVPPSADFVALGHRPQLAFADVERALGGAAADAAPGQAPARAAPEPSPSRRRRAAPPAAPPDADAAADLLTLAPRAAPADPRRRPAAPRRRTLRPRRQRPRRRARAFAARRAAALRAPPAPAALRGPARAGGPFDVALAAPPPPPRRRVADDRSPRRPGA
ncbi:hypothetical protein JL720_57 [Aureococcus anophagefferens]|nr:hypothetical protein JL720_57 [Aureococcus anophagefferens]